MCIDFEGLTGIQNTSRNTCSTLQCSTTVYYMDSGLDKFNQVCQLFNSSTAVTGTMTVKTSVMGKPAVDLLFYNAVPFCWPQNSTVCSTTEARNWIKQQTDFMMKMYEVRPSRYENVYIRLQTTINGEYISIISKG